MEGRKGHAESAVYQLSEESLDIVRQRLDARNPTNDAEKYNRPSKRQKLDNDEEILFIHGDKEDPDEYMAGGLDGHGLWKSEVEDRSEYTGKKAACIPNKASTSDMRRLCTPNLHPRKSSLLRIGQ